MSSFVNVYKGSWSIYRLSALKGLSQSLNFTFKLSCTADFFAQGCLMSVKALPLTLNCLASFLWTSAQRIAWWFWAAVSCIFLVTALLSFPQTIWNKDQCQLRSYVSILTLDHTWTHATNTRWPVGCGPLMCGGWSCWPGCGKSTRYEWSQSRRGSHQWSSDPAPRGGRWHHM